MKMARLAGLLGCSDVGLASFLLAASVGSLLLLPSLLLERSQISLGDALALLHTYIWPPCSWYQGVTLPACDFGTN